MTDRPTTAADPVASGPMATDVPPAPSLALPGARGRVGWGRRLWRDRRGATAVLVAVTLPILLAFAGLGVDVGWWYTIKRQNQSSADAAALSAAYEVAANLTSPTTNLQPAAQKAATANGYSGATLTGTGTCPSMPTASLVCYPYTDTYVPSTKPGVEVVLQQQQNSWFANFAPLASLTISNRAVAQVQVLGPACILSLETTGTGIGITGNYGISTPNCTIVADSTSSTAIDGTGNGCIQAYTLVSAGGYSFTGNSTSPCQSNGYDLTSPPRLGAANIANPYAGTLTHAFMIAGMPTTLCGAPKQQGSTYTYSPNCVITGSALSSLCTICTIDLSGGNVINGGLSLSGVIITLNLSPGTYWFNNGPLYLNGDINFNCQGCAADGAGVTLIFTTTSSTGGTIGSFTEIGNVTNGTFYAPSSGTYAGYLMLQDTVAGVTPSSSSSTGNIGFTGSGLLYFPNSALPFTGNISTAANCLVAVAQQFTFTGNLGLNSSGCPAAGLATVPTLYTVTLVE
jgi:hypothetical protein